MAGGGRPIARSEATPNPETVRRPPLLGPGGERVEPPVFGEGLLRRVSAAFERLDALLQRTLAAEHNPLAQTGAVANTTFIVAAASGVLLLVWYRTSVHEAHSSVVSMMRQPYLAGLVRSIHRYSSDACMLFVLIHALKLFTARRFGGARWLAWVTGIVLVSSLWFVGWTGYWLVWDSRAHGVALGTARLLDALPIFADPLSRSFLTDGSINSLLFFVVFFVHMLVPLAMCIALWLHITRLSRSRFLTGRVLTGWIVVSLVALSLLLPADVERPARMAALPDRFAIDAWYLLPLSLSDRLGGGLLWALLLISGSLLFSLPWLLVRRRARPAEVIVERCNACEKCYRDCPYDAIRMVPRSDDKPYRLEARVNPDKCVGCGICAGSCDSAGIGVWWFSQLEQRKLIDRQIAAAVEEGTSPLLALVCAESAGSGLDLDATGTCQALPDYRVVRVPCAGWIHPLSVERAIRRGARGVLIGACGEGGCMYREGGDWTVQRMNGTREPALRSEKMGALGARVLQLFGPERTRLLKEARAFADGCPPDGRPASGGARVAVGLALAAAFAAAVWGGTRIGYAAPSSRSAELVVSFKHPGSTAQACHAPSAAEVEKLPPHMRPKQICTRGRAAVRLRVLVDGELRVQRSYEPRGMWHDGNSIAIEHIPLNPGRHRVRVEIGDTANESELNHVSEREVPVELGHRTVVLFDKLSGFSWHS